MGSAAPLLIVWICNLRHIAFQTKNDGHLSQCRGYSEAHNPWDDSSSLYCWYILTEYGISFEKSAIFEFIEFRQITLKTNDFSRFLHLKPPRFSTNLSPKGILIQSENVLKFLKGSKNPLNKFRNYSIMFNNVFLKLTMQGRIQENYN